MLALTTLNLTDGSFHVYDYVQWLTEPQAVGAGILVSNTPNCFFIEGNALNMSVSLRGDLELGGSGLGIRCK